MMRHRGHFDQDALPEVRGAIADGRYLPMQMPAATIVVDTSAGYDPPVETLLAAIRRCLL